MDKLDDNTVLVGAKPSMSYVLAVITRFSEGSKNVQLRARGRAISRAVDVAEVVRNKFMKNLKTDVVIATEKVNGKHGGKVNVSTIKITLTKI